MLFLLRLEDYYFPLSSPMNSQFNLDIAVDLDCYYFVGSQHRIKNIVHIGDSARCNLVL